jgi:hypothetical protein
MEFVSVPRALSNSRVKTTACVFSMMESQWPSQKSLEDIAI